MYEKTVARLCCYMVKSIKGYYLDMLYNLWKHKLRLQQRHLVVKLASVEVMEVKHSATL